jgi:hypothetical protein
MKKITLFTFLICLISGSAYSQFIGKNALLANGSVSFSALKNSDSDDKYSTLSLNPWAGYTVIDNLVAGVFVNYVRSHSVEGLYKYTDTRSLIGPMIRYYHTSGAFGHAQVGFGSLNSKTETDGGSTFSSKYNLVGWAAGGGYAIRIADVALFEPMLLYQSTKTKLTNGSTTDAGLVVMGSFTIFLQRP